MKKQFKNTITLLSGKIIDFKSYNPIEIDWNKPVAKIIGNNRIVFFKTDSIDFIEIIEIKK